MNHSDIIKKVNIEDIDFISLDGLTDKEIERQKNRLIKKHVRKATAELKYSVSDETRTMCNSRIFFVQYENYLVLCGVYKVHEKIDQVGSHISIRQQIYDYVLYSETTGFYVVRGCSAPFTYVDSAICTSPCICFGSGDAFHLLQYGKTYLAAEFTDVFVIHNTVTHVSRYSEKFHEISVFHNDIQTFHLPHATLFCDLPSADGHFVYTTEQNHMGWNIPAKLVNVFTLQETNLRCVGNYSFPYNVQTTLSCVMADTDNSERRLSDDENYYFYICKNNTIAFDTLMVCVDKYGTVTRMDNLLPEDPSVNYNITLPKTTPEDVVSFVFGVIYKSRVLYPVIMGCPIHDVMELLCSDCTNNPYELPQHSIDTTSANNIIEYVRHRFNLQTNGEVAHLLTNHYGRYAAATRHNKYWLYFHGEGLRCEYLPRSMESLYGCPIDGKFVKSLEKSTLDQKWKSEVLLYHLAFSYFDDAVMHYTSPWLGQQHLDIYIPSLSVGIEYQGQQHYEASGFFGGEIGLSNRQFLDAKKRDLCAENNVLLIEWPYTLPITPINLIYILQAQNINSIPVPDPFRVPPETHESDVEEKIALKICQYSIDGDYLAEYTTINEAATSTGVSKTSIHKAITGQFKTAGNFQWRRMLSTDVTENITPIDSAKHGNQSKAVYQLSPEGEILAEYASIGKAAKETGITPKSIRSVISGAQKQAGGYLWVLKVED